MLQLKQRILNLFYASWYKAKLRAVIWTLERRSVAVHDSQTRPHSNLPWLAASVSLFLQVPGAAEIAGLWLVNFVLAYCQHEAPVRDVLLVSHRLLGPLSSGLSPLALLVEAVTAIHLYVPNDIWKVSQHVLENLYQLQSLPVCLTTKYTFDCKC